ncbi:molybdopterin molybdochelatase [Stella humosa]|uniref:Molybdopterin molybdenumtransferase n=1 Tax=Stella humosa TaxID=94 RepID=A0A3N1MKV5_9PROT|nr:gephyrin-like molybdotransferase Glp [Stella humosa]ROQ01636.1 molybdopterin molybdochelatase [Stella humosa]BBK32017.1 molybdopterin molybdenumtransferase MoeA [Stella humosa]
MISVEEARRRILAGLAVLPAEQVVLTDALGRVLAEDLVARTTQPPAPVSAMDGWAVRAADVASVPCRLRIAGYVPAGQHFEGTVGPGEAVRIFTGAPVPDGADAIVIQEDADQEGDAVVVREGVAAGRYVRRAGLDFSAGDVGVRAGTLMGPRAVGLAAAMNVPWLRVRRRPRVAILPTGDEIVMPGEPIGRNQIVSSNALALAAFVRQMGGLPVDLGIAADDRASLAALAGAARGCDLLVTTGGASVGEHDLVRSVLGEAGLQLDFWQIAMRPGKPLMFGQLAGTPMLGLPGNPVSALVCAVLFLRPAIARLCGMPDLAAAEEQAVLGADLGANDRREDYLRATLDRTPDGRLRATPFPTQDSSNLLRLVAADCLLVREPHAPPTAAGAPVRIVPLGGVFGAL